MTPTRRERKKQETRQRLLDVAWRSLQAKGYEHTTIEDITEAADVAKGTFFNYFESKDLLLDEIALWRIEQLGERVLSAGDVPESAVERIKLLMNAMARELAPGQELMHHLFVARLSMSLRHESAHRIGSLVHKLVKQGQSNGEIRDDVSPEFAARLLMAGWFYHLAGWWHGQDVFPEEAELTRSIDVLMSGLQGAGRRST